MKEAVSQSCPGEGDTVTGCDCLLHQHLALAAASMIHEVYGVELPHGSSMASAPAFTAEASCSKSSAWF